MTELLPGAARSLAAMAIVYVCGYVTGSLLVAPTHDRRSLSLGMVRLVAGLMLTAVAFLLALKLQIPWFTGPVGLVVLSAIVHGRAALAPPRPRVGFDWSDAAAGLLAIVVLAPALAAALRMAPGAFPPVFFNVDTPYFLEKVHALVMADRYPPESLGVLGGRRPYHFGAHAIAALISRGSSVAPHHSLFLIVVPVLAAGTLAAAVVLARAISPALPSMATVPLLLVAVPTLWYEHWALLAPSLRDAFASGSLRPLDRLTSNWETWFVIFNVQNLAGHFLVLASLGAMANAPSVGWRLATFLTGGAVLFKSPAGVALAAGFSLAQGCRAVVARSLRPLRPAVAAATVFAAVYGAFWILSPIPAELSVVLSPLYLLDYLHGRGMLLWFLADVGWLLLPAIIVLVAARVADPEKRSLPLLCFAAAPLIVVNVLRTVDNRQDFGISSMNEDDWRQIVLPVPLLIHAFALSVAGARWARLGTGVRSAFLVAVFLSVLPPAFVAARHTQVLLLEPDNAHEFADNRDIGDALAHIPRDGTLIVTNDLRYPADGFRRDDRQMQVPALFGHQAFAVNYMYEAYPFSPERRELQRLLEDPQWTPAIDEAARSHGWTHLLIRRDSPHPEPIPLERVFDNGVYSVYRFATR